MLRLMNKMFLNFQTLNMVLRTEQKPILASNCKM
nr:unnamed protein product [Callosobruchus chinensis]